MALLSWVAIRQVLRVASWGARFLPLVLLHVVLLPLHLVAGMMGLRLSRRYARAPYHLPVTTLRGVLAGCGYIASSHLRAWRAIPGVAIEAAVDPDLARAAALAREHGIGLALTDAAEAIERVRPDFVDIAAGPEAHVELVEMAVAAGCHVLCQKPLAPDLAGAERIVRAERESGRVVAVNEMWKWLPGYELARRVTAEGLVGEPREVRFRLAANLMLPEVDGAPPRRLRPGGQVAFAHLPRVLLFDFGMHPIDIARSLLGPRATVAAAWVSRLSPALRGDDTALLRLRFPAGEAIIDLDWSAPGPVAEETIDLETLALAGSEGLLTVEGARTVTWRPRAGAGWSRTLEGDRRHAAFTASQRDFVEAVRHGRPPASPPSDHIENLRIALAAYELSGWQL